MPLIREILTVSDEELMDDIAEKVLDEANLRQSFFAVNRNMIKNFSLVREMGDESIEKLIQPESGV